MVLCTKIIQLLSELSELCRAELSYKVYYYQSPLPTLQMLKPVTTQIQRDLSEDQIMSSYGQKIHTHN